MVKATYTGQNGEHFMGVPARDLDGHDWERLTDEQRAAVAASTFYRMAEEQRASYSKRAVVTLPAASAPKESAAP